LASCIARWSQRKHGDDAEDEIDRDGELVGHARLARERNSRSGPQYDGKRTCCPTEVHCQSGIEILEAGFCQSVGEIDKTYGTEENGSDYARRDLVGPKMKNDHLHPFSASMRKNSRDQVKQCERKQRQPTSRALCPSI